ncbi:hypothetical protein GCM10027451_43310 [Geodermatophilus aquaeductus]|uniref:Glycosyltransferase involved in cell wall bisynthesis n=1 Tax=Geodermatophilus aquaeductus TaxID=1564161 RepID=A0A521FQM9_9ACTN|nr:glycosyltransferase [Geodermatophilus aquaeductus]SMO98527.1 Glycosyltransferase involved in cell wall bisynthesis [Geodermatophilus aquaeductus]
MIGGAERFLHNLVSGLPRDVDVTVLGTSRIVVDEVAVGRHGTVTEVVDDTVRSFWGSLGRARPDVVHVNLTALTSCRRAVVASLLRRIPVVLVDHLPTPGLTWRGRFLQRLMTSSSSARIAVGSNAAREVERHGGVRHGVVHAIPNGVPEPDCAASTTTGTRLTVGVLARLEPQKGIDVLLRALVDLPEVTLLVAGDGGQRDRLEDLVRERDLSDRVEFLGNVDSPCEVLGRVQALVQPSRWEGMPLAVLEAMHVGLPVVATDVGSLREVVVDGETGLLVPPDDPGALAAALRRLLDDPALRTELGAAARIRARRDFSVRSMSTRYDEHYRAACGVAAPSRR